MNPRVADSDVNSEGLVLLLLLLLLSVPFDYPHRGPTLDGPMTRVVINWPWGVRRARYLRLSSGPAHLALYFATAAMIALFFVSLVLRFFSVTSQDNTFRFVFYYLVLLNLFNYFLLLSFLSSVGNNTLDRTTRFLKRIFLQLNKFCKYLLELL